jgi:hypothetical protein
LAVALHEDVACEQGHNLFRRNLLADAGHSQERSQRSWDDDSISRS